MTQCVSVSGTGYLYLTDPQPETFEACAYVIQSGTEVVASPFLLDQAAAGSLAAAFAGLWAIAYVLKLLRRQLWES